MRSALDLGASRSPPYQAMQDVSRGQAPGDTGHSGTGGHVGGEDVVRVAVQVLAGPAWEYFPAAPNSAPTSPIDRICAAVLTA